MSDPTTETSVEPGPYDVDGAIRDLARHRRRRDPGTRGILQLADDLAAAMQSNFSAEEMETVGRALVIAAASTGPLAQYGASPKETTVATMVCNITAFAGERLIRDARAIDEAGLS